MTLLWRREFFPAAAASLWSCQSKARAQVLARNLSSVRKFWYGFVIMDNVESWWHVAAVANGSAFASAAQLGAVECFSPQPVLHCRHHRRFYLFFPQPVLHCRHRRRFYLFFAQPVLHFGHHRRFWSLSSSSLCSP